MCIQYVLHKGMVPCDKSHTWSNPSIPLWTGDKALGLSNNRSYGAWSVVIMVSYIQMVPFSGLWVS